MRVFLRLIVVLTLSLCLATLVCGSSLVEGTAGQECEADGPATARFSEAGDGTVTAVKSGVIRRYQKAAGGAMSWARARAYCDSLGLAGLRWRLPTRVELEAIQRPCPVDGCRMETPFAGPCSYYWAAEREDDADPDSPAGFTDMGFGGSGFDAPDHEHEVRCVAVE